MHPLTILAVGQYGKTLMNQNGARIRLVVPWKHGFKSIKSNIKFVEEEAPASWNITGPDESGFQSYSIRTSTLGRHPSEKRLPWLFASYKTHMFHGYGDPMASMYAGLDLRKDYWSNRKSLLRGISEPRFRAVVFTQERYFWSSMTRTEA